MARTLDKSQGIDPENAAALGGAPRSRRNTRENDARNSRAARKRRDKFFVPAEAIPPGWCVEWKRVTCYGKPEEVDYSMDLAEQGWKIATPKQFPMLVPEGFDGQTIERGGMRLYIRPAHMKKESARLDYEEATAQVRDKLNEIGMTGEGELPRKVQGFNREWDRPAGRMIPDDDGAEPSQYEQHEGSDARAGDE